MYCVDIYLCINVHINYFILIFYLIKIISHSNEVNKPHSTSVTSNYIIFIKVIIRIKLLWKFFKSFNKIWNNLYTDIGIDNIYYTDKILYMYI